MYHIPIFNGVSLNIVFGRMGHFKTIIVNCLRLILHGKIVFCTVI